MREWRKGWHDVGETISLIGTKIHIVTDGAKTHEVTQGIWSGVPGQTHSVPWEAPRFTIGPQHTKAA